MNPSKLICWNVRGLNSRARQDTVRTLITSCQAEIVCLQETKMSGIPRGCILSLLGSDFPYWLELPSAGASGGILVAWRIGWDLPALPELIISASQFSFLLAAHKHGGSLVYMVLKGMTIKFSFCKSFEL